VKYGARELRRRNARENSRVARALSAVFQWEMHATTNIAKKKKEELGNVYLASQFNCVSLILSFARIAVEGSHACSACTFYIFITAVTVPIGRRSQYAIEKKN